MKAKLMMMVMSGLWLSACGGKKHHHEPAPPSMAFVCENGDIATITHFDGLIELALKYDVTPPKTVLLPQVQSGSGEAYESYTGFFGYGAQWQQKGALGYLTFNTPEGVVEVACQAQ